LRASRAERTGAVGVSDVQGNLQRIGWGPVENPNHDLGTDLFVQIRDERRFDLGTLIGVQVKSGPSWFEQPTYDQNGDIDGWWFYEETPRHFEYWTEHSLPHILALNDEVTRTTYWAQVTAEALVPTGQGAKVRVPRTQVIEPSQLPALLAVATPALGNDYQGSVWSGSARTIGLERRLRYALLAPRLIAPHRNAGLSIELEPEEALALVMQGRLRDLNSISQQVERVPAPEEALTHRTWRWRLVGAAWRAATGEDDAIPLLRAMHDSARPGSTDSAAACALLICSYLNEERWQDALQLARSMFESDSLEPADHAWITAHRISLESEVGDYAAAIRAATELLQGIRTSHADLTTIAMQSVAAWAVFHDANAGLRGPELGVLLSASDNYLSWWRQNSASYGLAEAQVVSFRAQFRDTTTRWSFEDVAASRIWSAATTAQVCGDYATRRSHLRQLAMYELTQSTLEGNPQHVTKALDTLRKSTDTDLLKIVTQYLELNGPLSALTATGPATIPARWAHSTSRSTLEVWTRCGDFIAEELADQAVTDLLRILRDPSQFLEDVRPSFSVREHVVDALRGLSRACSKEVRARIVLALVSLQDVGDSVLAANWSRLVARLLPYVEAERDDWPEGLADAGRRQSDTRLSAALLELAADSELREELESRAATGDDDALGALGDVRQLAPEVVSALIGKHVDALANIRQSAAGNSWGFGGHESAHIVALLSLHWPSLARWDELLALLLDPRVGAHDKNESCRLLAEEFESLPPDVQEEIRAEAHTLVSMPELTGDFGRPIPSGTMRLAMASGGLAQDEVAAVISTALLNPVNRAEAARLLHFSRLAGSAIGWLVLLTDPDPAIRSGAAACLIERLDQDPTDQIAEEGVRRALQDGGVVVPLTLAIRLHSYEADGKTWAKPFLAQLSTHASAAVRLAASVGRTV